MSRATSASTRNVAVSDQFRTFTVMLGPGGGAAPLSILVNAQGPATQETRALWNSCPWPASMFTPPIVAFHFPSGEQGVRFAQATSPAFGTVNVLAILPTFTLLVVFSEYRIRTSFTATSCAPATAIKPGVGVIRATY